MARAIYTIDFSESRHNATEYETIDESIIVKTDGETVNSEVKTENTLEVVISGSTYVIPLLEEQLKKKVPHNTLIDCTVR